MVGLGDPASTTGRRRAPCGEIVPTPTIGEADVVLVMAAGVSCNGVWAALGETGLAVRWAQAGVSWPAPMRQASSSGPWAPGEALEPGRRGS